MSDVLSFIVNKSQVIERYDPYYIYHKIHSNLETTYNSIRLGSLVKTFSGGTPSKNNPDYWNGSIPWISPKDFQNIDLYKSEDKITVEGLKSSSSKIAPKNSVIIVVRSGVLAHSFPVCINHMPAAINQDLKVLVPISENPIPRYLAYYFYVFGKKLLPLITKRSTTVHSINTEQFERLKIPVPPLDVQKKIVELLDGAQEKKNLKIAEAETILQGIYEYLLSELGIEIPEKDTSLENRTFRTNFSLASGLRIDPDYHLNKLLFHKMDPKYPFRMLNDALKDSPQYGANESAIDGNPESDVRYIRITDIDNEGQLKRDGWQTAAKINDKYLLKDDDILFARTGSVGRCFHYKSEYGKAIFAGYLIRFKVDKNILLPEYLFHYSYSKAFELWKNMIQRPTVQANINSEEYKNLLIPIPPIETQKKLVNEIETKRAKVDSLRKQAHQQLKDARQQIEQIIIDGDEG